MGTDNIGGSGRASRARAPALTMLAAFALTSACGAEAPPPPNTGPAPGETTVTVIPPDPASAQQPDQDATAAAEPAAGGFKVTLAMPMEGTLDKDKLVSELNLQLADLHACAAIVRETDDVVGSLNVRITAAADGKVTPELQSPVNERAEKCLLDGMRAWTIKEAGQGTSMVLLELSSPPDP